MKKYNFKELFDDLDRNSLTYNLEGAVIDFTESMLKTMEDQGVSRSELARRIGTSPAYITKILRGSTNFTFESVVKVAMALNCEFKPQLKVKDADNQAHDLYHNYHSWAFSQGSFPLSSTITNNVLPVNYANKELEDDSLALVA